MYCIISLPRTASTSAWHLLYSSLMMTHPEVAHHPLSSKTSAFNPRYNTPEKIEDKFQKIITSDPLPLIKIISNHDFSMVKRILDTPYKTIFIEPVSLKKQVLKVLVAKKTDSFVNKQQRTQHVGTIEITKDEILQRFDYYQKHLEFRNVCDYVVTDKMIIEQPEVFQTWLNVPIMKSKHKYESFAITDEMMLQDVQAFNELYDTLSMETFGEVI
jgi:hypothetical protein